MLSRVGAANSVTRNIYESEKKNGLSQEFYIEGSWLCDCPPLVVSIDAAVMVELNLAQILRLAPLSS